MLNPMVKTPFRESALTSAEIRSFPGRHHHASDISRQRRKRPHVAS